MEQGAMTLEAVRKLADYIEACDYDYDGLSHTIRVAVVRLLRKLVNVK